MKRVFLISLLAAATITMSSAQRGQNRNQNQQGRMEQRVGSLVQNAVETLSKKSDPLELIYRQDVQKDLQLDLGQRNKLDNLHDKQQREIAAVIAQNRRNRGASLAEPQEKARAETQAKIDELLTDAQKARLHQISLQMMGSRSLFMDDVQKSLAITEEQKAQLSAIEAQQSASVNQLQTQIAARQVRPDELTTALVAINKQTDESITALLTEDQKKALDKLFGAKFKETS